MGVNGGQGRCKKAGVEVEGGSRPSHVAPLITWYVFVFVCLQAHFDVDGKRHFPFGRGHMDALVRMGVCKLRGKMRACVRRG